MLVPEVNLKCFVVGWGEDGWLISYGWLIWLSIKQVVDTAVVVNKCTRRKRIEKGSHNSQVHNCRNNVQQSTFNIQNPVFMFSGVILARATKAV